MSKEVLIHNEDDLRSKIYTIRGVQVMLDFDLAEIYGYDTKRFNEQVKNNKERFDEDFRFQLTKEEFDNLRSKNSTAKTKMTSKSRSLPYAFTEQGIYMLMTVLRGDLATAQSKALIRIFKQMKDFTDPNIRKDYLFLNGETVEADIAYSSIYSSAKKTIFIVDNYISLKTLVLLKTVKPNVQVTLFSDNIGKGLHKTELLDFCKEYPNVHINLKKTNRIYHDRYIFIDFGSTDEKIYHCGGSSKDGGIRTTAISQVEDTSIYKIIAKDLQKNPILVL